MNISGILEIFEQLPSYEQTAELIAARHEPLALGLPKAAQAPTLAKQVLAHDGPVLLLTGRVENVPIWQQELEAWLPDDQPLRRFAEPTPLPYDRGPWSENSRQQRLTILSLLMAGQHPLIPASQQPVRVVASARALLHKTLPKRSFLKGTRVLRLGQMIDWLKLEESWTAVGYERVTVVERPGQYSQRGGILDIFPAGGALFPIRIELFGDEIDTLRWFDPATQRTAVSSTPPQRVLIPPAREAIPSDALELGQIFQLDAPAKADDLPAWQDDIPAIAEGRPFDHLEFYLPLLYRRPDSLLHYLPDNALVVVDDWVTFTEAVHELHGRAFQLRQEQASLPETYPNPLFGWDELKPLLTAKKPLILGDHQPADERESNLPLTPLAECVAPGPRYGGQMRPLMFQLQYAKRTAEPTIVISRQAERLADLWRQEQGISREEWAGRSAVFRVHQNVETLDFGNTAVQFVNGSLSEGFTLERATDNRILLNLLTDAEIFGWNRPAPRVRRRQQTYAPETYFADISEGDYVVHTEYGIGRFMGLVVRSIGGSNREYLQIAYDNDDVLYVPVHHADRLSKWIGTADFAPKLHRLGGKKWSEAKKRAQRDINEMADELLELYATRETVHGHAFATDNAWQIALEASFPYQETNDQLHAIEAVKADMEKPQPMDRLICGDVGYGKTEVALRAAFKAVMDGRQVAILVPTTVLAQQHYHTFRERLEPYPVKIAMLSRFRTQTKQRASIAGLQDGEVDIVVGTHRLLSDDVGFKDLGLLIIDEEQRFGVAHKEKLKQLRTEVDVLTMTATPIPRTMHMALSGLRDISVISTAPAERLPVQTYVGEFEEQLVRRAILRELDRGGQIYFVHNRVQTIQAIYRRMAELVPEAIVAIGHGQMSERELERVMSAFAAGQIDILLSTTIIESGLDIPNANTMIVDRADRFGLAQLYQLRGRIGRGAHRAYAYFFHAPWRTLTPEAKARLEAISEATELGAGYAIAMRDLEIRGTGELLGSSQSGHIGAIGFDLYTKMLAGAVRARRQAKDGEVVEISLPEHTLIDLPLATYIPTDYVADAGLRLRLYRRMAVLLTLEEIEQMATELVDRFGPLPDPMENLLFQLRIKVLAMAANATAVTYESQQIRIQIPNLPFIDRNKLQRKLGSPVRVSRTGIWFLKGMPTREWQVALVQVLEKLKTMRE